jgi:GT2 family glycosyltransferase
MAEEGRVYGVLVTFRRPAPLTATLAWLAGQDRQLDRLVVVDNDASEYTKSLVNRHSQLGHAVDYLETEQNLGPAGGRALGMQHILEFAEDADWMVVVDDDVRRTPSGTLRYLHEFARQMQARDPWTAAIGRRGARFDWKRAKVVRVRDDELDGPVAVDYLATGHLPMYRVEAVRKVGPFRSELFFGLTEIEYGLRLRRAGYSLYADGPSCREARIIRLGLEVRGSVKVGEPTWRRYYSLRNLIYVLRAYGHPATAARVTLVRGFGKPAVNLLSRPRLALRNLKLNVKACRDAWTGRMGRTIEPDSYSASSSPNELSATH